MYCICLFVCVCVSRGRIGCVWKVDVNLFGGETSGYVTESVDNWGILIAIGAQCIHKLHCLACYYSVSVVFFAVDRRPFGLFSGVGDGPECKNCWCIFLPVCHPLCRIIDIRWSAGNRLLNKLCVNLSLGVGIVEKNHWFSSDASISKL